MWKRERRQQLSRGGRGWGGGGGVGGGGGGDGGRFLRARQRENILSGRLSRCSHVGAFQPGPCVCEEPMTDAPHRCHRLPASTSHIRPFFHSRVLQMPPLL